ncbi:MAG: arginine--tRNA ligase [Patescibacteria group bacterium]
MKQKIFEIIQTSIERAKKSGKLPAFVVPEIIVDHPNDKEHGDFSCSIALSIGKILKQNPMEIAQIIYDEIELSDFDKVEIMKPGFINFFLSNNYLIDELEKILKEGDKYGSGTMNKTVVVDYSAPNIAKPFGIGHLRSTIIGQAIYNIYSFLGAKCIGDNHLGDWGTQFGKMIVAIKIWANEDNIKDLTIADLEKLYVKFHEESVVDGSDLEEQARSWFKKLEDGDEEARAIWQTCIDISLKEFDRIYKLLGVKIDYTLGESFYGDKMIPIIEEALKKKIAKKSRGAVIVEFEDKNLPPAMILKSDEATNYFTRDLATIKYRLEAWDPDLIIYEVGAEQKLHFKQLFKTVNLLGWISEDKLVHVAHGFYRNKEGKFSTRKGKTIHLESVLNEAIDRARKVIDDSQTNKELSDQEKNEISRIVGIGAVKYNDLSQHYSKEVVFDWDKILNLKGDSGPYLQYVYTRCASIVKKAEIDVKLKKKEVELNAEELEILREIYKFPEVVRSAANKFSPNLICNFAFNLAQQFNSFYQAHSVLGADSEESKMFRVALTQGVAQILKSSLLLLGIEIPEKM